MYVFLRHKFGARTPLRPLFGPILRARGPQNAKKWRLTSKCKILTSKPKINHSKFFVQGLVTHGIYREKRIFQFGPVEKKLWPIEKKVWTPKNGKNYHVFCY